VVRHARATEVTLKIELTPELLHIVIEDNGCGFDSRPQDPEADGLHNMAQRLKQIGGNFLLESRPGSGTRASFIVPWPPRNK
jgi:signal transduction histidine kinase